ncbi:hypothetical protein VOLCADRAFT_105674 [Volvox carteri f. nagariensis]|uniref:Myb-like domain-containing protein n=1 Tax=Volvox carteri f. nagariensis TaxID=3068 RepID=D8U2B2_VOLCA|nr:uncharacterized protein VOLCADRAFT_105674 [Volvox carteri f. nagariensis]EFJ46033.1 hypothetical protein VOLCADRAFT_105674 [Volvox carteri f. nagariensis]|eukprot:XP_002952783.1 hypothetical protein VOLCADRAFT_105674 [Volvox carteri f. nagariensis]
MMHIRLKFGQGLNFAALGLQSGEEWTFHVAQDTSIEDLKIVLLQLCGNNLSFGQLRLRRNGSPEELAEYIGAEKPCTSTYRPRPCTLAHHGIVNGSILEVDILLGQPWCRLLCNQHKANSMAFWSPQGGRQDIDGSHESDDEVVILDSGAPTKHRRVSVAEHNHDAIDLSSGQDNQVPRQPVGAPSHRQRRTVPQVSDALDDSDVEIQEPPNVAARPRRVAPVQRNHPAQGIQEEQQQQQQRQLSVPQAAPALTGQQPQQAPAPQATRLPLPQTMQRELRPTAQSQQGDPGREQPQGLQGRGQEPSERQQGRISQREQGRSNGLTELQPGAGDHQPLSPPGLEQENQPPHEPEPRPSQLPTVERQPQQQGQVIQEPQMDAMKQQQQIDPEQRWQGMPPRQQQPQRQPLPTVVVGQARGAQRQQPGTAAGTGAYGGGDAAEQRDDERPASPSAHRTITGPSKHWTVVETQALADAMEEHGKRWAVIERETKLRDQKTLRYRWRNLVSACKTGWVGTRGTQLPKSLRDQITDLYNRLGA